MVDSPFIYSLLPIITGVSCAFLLYMLYQKRATVEYLLLFSNLAIMNTSQVGLTLLWNSSVVANSPIAAYFADAYLICMYFFFFHLFLFSASLSDRPMKKYYVGYIVPIFLTIAHLFGYMVDGFRFENNGLLHNDGPLAAAQDIFVIAACLGSVLMFFANIKSNKANSVVLSKSLIALLSFIPLILAFSVLIILSRTDHAVSLVVVGPLVSLYTALSFYYLSRERVVDLSMGLVLFWGRVKVAYYLLESRKTKPDLSKYFKLVETQIIREALMEAKGNIPQAAKNLKMHHTTLRMKINEYEIDIKG